MLKQAPLRIDDGLFCHGGDPRRRAEAQICVAGVQISRTALPRRRCPAACDDRDPGRKAKLLALACVTRPTMSQLRCSAGSSCRRRAAGTAPLIAARRCSSARRGWRRESRRIGISGQPGNDVIPSTEGIFRFFHRSPGGNCRKPEDLTERACAHPCCRTSG